MTAPTSSPRADREETSELEAMKGRLFQRVWAIEHNGWDSIFPFLRRRTQRLRQEFALVDATIKLHRLLLPFEPLP